MKNFTFLFALIAVTGSSAFAADHVLNGVDADDMASILRASGMPDIRDVTIEFISAQNPECVGANYVDQCEATPADSRPAANPRAIVSESAGKFWSLLKKAGFENQISQISDGTAGKTVISASRIDCSLTSYDYTKDQCVLQ